MPNIRILAKAVLQIFCLQGCSYTNACVQKGGVTQPKIYGIGSKVNQFIFTLIYAKYQDPSLSGSSDILFARLFIHSQKRGITPERQDQQRKKKIRFSLFFMYMPHIKFQDSSISGSGVSQLPKSVTDRQIDGQEYVQKLISSSTLWSVSICQISGS